MGTSDNRNQEWVVARGTSSWHGHGANKFFHNSITEQAISLPIEFHVAFPVVDGLLSHAHHMIQILRAECAFRRTTLEKGYRTSQPIGIVLGTNLVAPCAENVQNSEHYGVGHEEIRQPLIEQRNAFILKIALERSEKMKN
jgi:hypothetical protein